MATPGVRGGDNSSLILDLDNEPQPDALLRLLPEYGGQSRVGADGYLVGAPELIARVKALMRRAKQYTKEATTPSFTTGDLTVDFSQHQALREGQPINLTPTEYRILAHLARNAGRVVTQDDLLTKVWGPAYRDEAHLLRVNIARLRQKVEPEPSNPRYVITRPGIGYSLTKLDNNGQN